MSEDPRQRFHLDFEITAATLFTGKMFMWVRRRRFFTDPVLAVLSAIGWSMLTDQPLLSISTFRTAALLGAALLLLSLCLMVGSSLVQSAFPGTFLPFTRARIEFQESGVRVTPEDASTSFELPWPDIKEVTETLDFVFMPVVFRNKQSRWTLKKFIMFVSKQRLGQACYDSLKYWLESSRRR